jgi:hypothetical protein
MSTFSTCTSSTRPGSPTDGDVLFETDTKNVIIWDGTNWRGYGYDSVAYSGKTNPFALNFGTGSATSAYNDSINLFESGDPFTYLYWVKFDSVVSGQYMMFYDDALGFSNGFTQRFSASGEITTSVRVGSSGDAAFAKTGFTTGQWYMIAITYDSSTMAMKYLSGGSTTVNDGGSASVSNLDVGPQLRVGSDQNKNNTVDGIIDEVCLWDTALSDDALSQIYNFGNPVNVTSNLGDYTNSSNLVGYWTMDTGTGSTVSDSSTNSNLLTIQGTADYTATTP